MRGKNCFKWKYPTKRSDTQKSEKNFKKREMSKKHSVLSQKQMCKKKHLWAKRVKTKRKPWKDMYFEWFNKKKQFMCNYDKHVAFSGICF